MDPFQITPLQLSFILIIWNKPQIALILIVTSEEPHMGLIRDLHSKSSGGKHLSIWALKFESDQYSNVQIGDVSKLNQSEGSKVVANRFLLLHCLISSVGKLNSFSDSLADQITFANV